MSRSFRIRPSQQSLLRLADAFSTSGGNRCAKVKQVLKTTLLGFTAGLAGAFTLHQWQGTLRPVTEGNAPYRQADFRSPRAAALPLSGDFVAASALSAPSVVYIKTSTTTRSTDFLSLFFNGEGRDQLVVSSGSGVIFTSDGYIVTNHHVIENANKIEVVHRKRSYPAEIVGTDPSTDLAVLKVADNQLPAIRQGRSRDVQVGEWVLAVGNPFNLTSTVTAGIVSAKGRDIGILQAQFPIESFIQTDAAINPGNSGGALVNAKGELVGINTAILSRTGSYTGYGFAIPVDIVAKITNDLIQYGVVQKAFLGAEVTDLNPETARELKVDGLNGVTISYVAADGPAGRSGLRKGDVILRINGEAIEGKSAFNEQLSYYRPGDKIKVSGQRNGIAREVQLTLTNQDGTTGLLKKQAVYTVSGLGAELVTLSKVERDKLGITGGVRVAKLTPGLISRLGVEEGFVITAINRQTVQSPQEVAELLNNVSGRGLIEGVNRNGVGGYYSFYR
ncbi:MAG: trypsin-like peptidase domain-containing protein [Ferruginibacter sp.]|nr:trypsin-like peptidase domain-containing protein [Cytophagales bacterium]